MSQVQLAVVVEPDRREVFRYAHILNFHSQYNLNLDIDSKDRTHSSSFFTFLEKKTAVRARRSRKLPFIFEKIHPC